jgi:hypothetical protein
MEFVGYFKEKAQSAEKFLRWFVIYPYIIYG